MLEHHAQLAAVFRVRGRSFVWFLDNHHGDDRLWASCKAARVSPPSSLPCTGTASSTRRTFGAGWVGIRLDVGDIDWKLVAEVIEDGYRLTASRTLIAALDEGRSKRSRR